MRIVPTQNFAWEVKNSRLVMWLSWDSVNLFYTFITRRYYSWTRWICFGRRLCTQSDIFVSTCATTVVRNIYILDIIMIWPSVRDINILWCHFGNRESLAFWITDYKHVRWQLLYIRVTRMHSPRQSLYVQFWRQIISFYHSLTLKYLQELTS